MCCSHPLGAHSQLLAVRLHREIATRAAGRGVGGVTIREEIATPPLDTTPNPHSGRGPCRHRQRCRVS